MLLNIDKWFWYKNVPSCEGDTRQGNLGLCMFTNCCRKNLVYGFTDSLNDKKKWLVETGGYNRTFCFGDGVEGKVIKTVKFPITLENVKGLPAYEVH